MLKKWASVSLKPTEIKLQKFNKNKVICFIKCISFLRSFDDISTKKETLVKSAFGLIKYKMC